MPTLLELAERCETFRDWASRQDPHCERLGLNSRIAQEIGECGVWHPGSGEYDYPDYCGSLDAALTLVPEGAWWRWSVRHMPLGDYLSSVFLIGQDPEGKAYEELHQARDCSTPALALTAACLKARASILQDTQP